MLRVPANKLIPVFNRDTEVILEWEYCYGKTRITYPPDLVTVIRDSDDNIIGYEINTGGVLDADQKTA